VLAWWRADLHRWAKELQKGAPQPRAVAPRILSYWQQDPDLAGVRDNDGLAALPEAERKEWAKLWGDVAALLVKAGPKK
jgi:hypothetical protein